MTVGAPKTTANVAAGESSPLGATVQPNGVNFSIFSDRAERIELLLFDGEGARQPSRIVPLRPDRHRTYHYWHVFVPGLGPGQVYAYRAHGARERIRGFASTARRCCSIPMASP